MKRIEAIIRPHKLDEVKIALGEIGVTGMSVSDVRGFGGRDGRAMTVRLKMEIVARDEDVDEILETIELHARTGEPGDGKIFVMPMADAIRVRTEERGEDVL